MKSFWRVFEYVRPQWPRVVVIVISAILIAIFFSLSFMTIIPLLKVMMGQEGLHGWVDRKVCSQRYGLGFYVPDRADFMDPNKTDVAYYLFVNDVEEKSLSEVAGLIGTDSIIGVGRLLTSENIEKIPSSKLLKELATADSDTEMIVQYKRLTEDGNYQLLL